MSINRMDNYAKFLVDSGLLFEINLEILHPLGLALEVTTNEKTMSISGLWDYRDDPEGIAFTPETFKEGTNKLNSFLVSFGDKKHRERFQSLGYIIQNEVTEISDEDTAKIAYHGLTGK